MLQPRHPFHHLRQLWCHCGCTLLVPCTGFQFMQQLQRMPGHGQIAYLVAVSLQPEILPDLSAYEKADSLVSPNDISGTA